MTRRSMPFDGPAGTPVPPGDYETTWGYYQVPVTGEGVSITYASGGVALQAGLNESDDAPLRFQGYASTGSASGINAVGVRYTHLQGESWVRFSYAHPDIADVDVFVWFNPVKKYDGETEYPTGIALGSTIEVEWSSAAGTLTTTVNGALLWSRSVAVPLNGEPFIEVSAEGRYLIIGTDDEFMDAGSMLVDDLWFEAGAPAIRMFPRDDGLGMSSAPRIWPVPKARRVIGAMP